MYSTLLAYLESFKLCQTQYFPLKKKYPCVFSHCELSIMVDIAVKSGCAWICHTQGPGLTDILLSAQVTDEQFSHPEEDKTNR